MVHDIMTFEHTFMTCVFLQLCIFARGGGGIKNLSKKTLVDERFLI